MKFTLAFLALAAFVAASPVAAEAERDLAVEERADTTNYGRDAQLQDLQARGFIGTANPPVGVTLKCRRGASTAQSIVTTYARGASLNIKCQQLGENISGNSIWNKIDRFLAEDCYVSDYYTKTGYTWIPGVPRC